MSRAWVIVGAFQLSLFVFPSPLGEGQKATCPDSFGKRFRVRHCKERCIAFWALPHPAPLQRRGSLNFITATIWNAPALEANVNVDKTRLYLLQRSLNLIYQERPRDLARWRLGNLPAAERCHFQRDKLERVSRNKVSRFKINIPFRLIGQGFFFWLKLRGISIVWSLEFEVGWT